MKKSAITVIVLIVLVIVGILVFGRGGEAPTDTDTEDTTEAVMVEGVVTAVDAEGAMVDGPYLVTVGDGEGSETVIAIPSMGINLCAARDNIVAIDDIEVGDTVGARGSAGVDEQIVPCESEDHYVRVVNS